MRDRPQPPPPRPPQSGGTPPSAAPIRHAPGYPQRVLIACGISSLFVLLFVLLWFAGTTVLLVFSSVLIAVLLNDASSQLEKRMRLSHGMALGIVLLLAAALLFAGGLLLAPQLSEQVKQLTAELPAALQRLRDYFEGHPVLQQLSGSLPSPEKILSNASSLVSQAGTIFTGVLGGLGNIVIILFLSVYLAIQPRVYTDGIIKLLPQHRRPRGRVVLCELGETLSLWLRGKMLSMLVVGIATSIGLTLLGVPLGLALGVVAGLLDFIPYIGPLLAAVPAVLIAFSEGPQLALYVVLLFVALQMLEGYLLSPLVERKTVSLPPALTITMQILMGMAFGLGGVALASPLTAVVAVLIAMLYVEDVLEDRVELPSRKE